MGLRAKKFKYILIRNDRIEQGKAKLTKEKQLMLKHDIKHPKQYYIDDKGNKIYLFFDRLIDSVKFDFSLFENYTDQLRQEVENIQSSSKFIMGEVFAKGILEIDKEQRIFLILLLAIMLIGGIGIGTVCGIAISLLFNKCPECPKIPTIIQP